MSIKFDSLDFHNIHSDLFQTLSPEEQEILKKKNGSFWKCIWKMQNPLNPKGENYVFSAIHYSKEEENEIDKNIFPAVELPSWISEIQFGFPMSINPTLGYVFQEDLIILPDHKALEENWLKLQEKNPDLPPLKICDSQGIASDQDFIKAFLKGEIVLSDEKEFLHDQLVHVIPTLIAMKKPDYKYVETRVAIERNIALIYNLFLYAQSKMSENSSLTHKDIDALMFVLAFIVDNITASFTEHDEPLRESLRKSVKEIVPAMQFYWTASPTNEFMKSFYLRRFGNLSVNEKSFEQIIECITDLAKLDDSIPEEIKNTLSLVHDCILNKQESLVE